MAEMRKSIDSLIAYLKAGNEIELDGITYVWLHEHVIKTVGDTTYGINGLAYKGEVEIDGVIQDEPHYMGADITLMYFLKLVEEEVSEEDWFSIHARTALEGMNKRRKRRPRNE